jgi:hypothetical protein
MLLRFVQQSSGMPFGKILLLRIETRLFVDAFGGYLTGIQRLDQKIAFRKFLRKTEKHASPALFSKSTNSHGTNAKSSNLWIAVE